MSVKEVLAYTHPVRDWKYFLTICSLTRIIKSVGACCSVEWQGEEREGRRNDKNHELDFPLSLRSGEPFGLSYDEKSQRGGNRSGPS